MASSWGNSWGNSWGDSWGSLGAATPISVSIGENVLSTLRDDVWPDLLSALDEEGVGEGGVFPPPVFPGGVFPPPVFPGGIPGGGIGLPPVPVGDHRHVMAGPIRQTFNADLYILGSAYVAAEQ